MKRVRVYQQILSEDNLRLAIREVNRGHRRNGDHSLNKKVLEIEANMDEYVAELRRFIEDLVSGDAHMHPPLKRRRWDRNADSGKGKWRDINEPLLWPDQYVHHAVLQPMLRTSCGAWTNTASQACRDGEIPTGSRPSRSG